MTIFVTGGAGFIGSNFIFHMLKEHPDYRIVCLDKLTSASSRLTSATARAWISSSPRSTPTSW